MSAKNSRMRFILWIAGILAVLAMMSGAAADSEFTVTHGEYTIQQGSLLRVVGQYTPVFEQERIFYAIYGSDGKLIGAWYIEENQPAQGFSALWLPTSTLAVGSYQVVIYPAYFADGKWNRSENKVKRTLTVVDHQPERWEREENYTVHYNSDGVKDVGFTVIDGDLYYFNPDGVLQTNGWASIDGNDYYFDQVGRAQTGLTHIQDNYYFFDDQGIMRTGLHEADGHLYFFGSDGKHVQGHVTLDGVNYFFGEDGKGISGRAAVDGRSMYFENGVEKPDPSLEQTSAFVRRCYSLILGRTADEGGLNGWSEALIKKTAAAANIIDGFVQSEEFKNRNLSNGDKVDILYKTMLNREADAGGKAGWVDALGQGYTLQNIIDGFCGSSEFKAICDSYGIEPGSIGASVPTDTSTPRGKIEAFVKRCYQLILNRQADDGGLKGWSDALEGKTAAAAQIIDGFVRSPEYINRSLTSDQSVTILYKTMLDREPDAGGKAGWVDALSKGYTLQHIINGFCGSAEFTKICSDYGIQAGSVAVPAKVAAALEAAAQLEAKKLPDERIGNAVSADEAGIAVVIGYDPAEVEAFVKHAYRAVLGREADEDGLASWTEQIVSGAVAPKAFLRKLLNSDEFAARNLNSEAVVETLYKLYLNRGMDDAAAERIAQLAAGGLDEVIKGFEGSAEFRLVLNGFGL